MVRVERYGFVFDRGDNHRNTLTVLLLKLELLPSFGRSVLRKLFFG